MIRLILLRITESYFRHRWLYSLPVLLMAAVAAYYPSTLKPSYSAYGNIYIQDQTLLASLTALQNEGFGWVTAAQATSAEMTELFNTDAFVNAVIQQTDLAMKLTGNPNENDEVLKEVRSLFWVRPLGNNLLAFGANHEDPRIAYQLATHMIDVYIQWKINIRLDGGTAAQSFFVDLIRNYQAELDPIRQQLTEYLTNHPEPLRGARPAAEIAEIARLQAIVDQGMERVRSAESKEENARLAMVQTEDNVRQTYFTVDVPVMPTEPVRSRKDMLMVMVGCVAAGFVLSGIAVVGGALLDQSYRFPIDVRNGLGLTVLTMVPQAKESTWFVTSSSPMLLNGDRNGRSPIGDEQFVITKS